MLVVERPLCYAYAATERVIWGMSIGCVPAALPRLTVQAACLTALRRVDPMKADSLAVDIEGVAVDHPRWAGDIGEGERR